VTFCLFDTIKKRKISENFTSFVAHGSVSQEILPKDKNALDCSRCIFRSSFIGPQVQLLVQVSKLLVGDYDEATEFYMKTVTIIE